MQKRAIVTVLLSHESKCEASCEHALKSLTNGQMLRITTASSSDSAAAAITDNDMLFLYHLYSHESR